MKIFMILTMLSSYSFATTCYQSSKKADFVEIYDIQVGNGVLDLDSWDYYYGFSSSVDHDYAMTDHNKYEYMMEKEAREAYYLKEYLEDGFQVYEAENEEGSKVKITLTGEIAERLPYGLRSWLKNKTGYGSRKAEIALVDWKDADKISEAYCF